MDIGLFPSADGTSFDFGIVNGDLALDSTLQTAVILSLMCDRLADPDDVIPDSSGNRRGWFGDAFLPPLADGAPDFLGSKLWLYVRCTATQQNANLIAAAAYDALAWMISDGVAASVTVTPSWVDAQSLQLTIQIAETSAPGTAPPTQFSTLWNRTTGQLSPISGFTPS